MDDNNRVQWVYGAPDRQELENRYDVWAKDYDRDLDESFGYVGPRLGAECFARYVATDAHILDAGAGTGLVGIELANLGYKNIDGMDMSQGMLDEARKKGVYRELRQMVLGEPLDYADGEFDAVISVGVLTLGHAPASSLDELVRVVRAGGHVVYSLRPDVYGKSGFREKHAELEAASRWKLVEVSDEVKVLPKGEPEVAHQVWVFRVL
ncbi:class I SAM-dependent DNA methyltransferase [Chloroflexota bacterium]